MSDITLLPDAISRTADPAREFDSQIRFHRGTLLNKAICGRCLKDNSLTSDLCRLNGTENNLN